MLATTIRQTLTMGIGMIIIVGLLAILTTTVTIAAPPQTGLEDGNGQVVGLDDLAATTTPTMIDPKIVISQCFPSECASRTSPTTTTSGIDRDVAQTGTWTSMVAGFNQIGFTEH